MDLRTKLMLCDVFFINIGLSSMRVSVRFYGDYKTVTKMRHNLATLSFWDVTGSKTVVYV